MISFYFVNRSRWCDTLCMVCARMFSRNNETHNIMTDVGSRFVVLFTLHINLITARIQFQLATDYATRFDAMMGMICWGYCR